MTTRIEGTVTSISWIPSEAVSGLPRLPFSGGVAHYDDPPPDRIDATGSDSLDGLRAADRFRFANELRAFVDFDDDGAVSAAGYLAGGRIGATTMRIGRGSTTVAAVAMSDRQREPERGPGWVRFTQSAGGRTGVPAPRTVRHPPFVQYQAPTAWTTLELTIHADGRIEHRLVGASPFPRHWIYGNDGHLVAKSGLIDFKQWYTRAFGKHTPWGDLDSAAVAVEVESALERELSLQLMRGGSKPEIRGIKRGAALVEQGRAGHELFVVLDGVLAVEVDGEALAEVGPGTVLGERAVLEGGLRTATLRAVTACKVAVVTAAMIDDDRLLQLAEGHRRELPAT